MQCNMQVAPPPLAGSAPDDRVLSLSQSPSPGSAQDCRGGRSPPTKRRHYRPHGVVQVRMAAQANHEYSERIVAAQSYGPPVIEADSTDHRRMCHRELKRHEPTGRTKSSIRRSDLPQ